MAAGQGVKLTWNGPALQKQVLEAARKGLNATLSDCVLQAQQPGYVPVAKVAGGTLRSSLRFEAAKVNGTKIEGSFGSYTINYALWQEIGTRFFVGKFYLRRSADLHAKTLPDRIKEFMP